jgi:bifunctional DNA-binding transcriptional regulator/antitoxin component of YhaV-PrlF toxin-antitoxin module
VRWTIANNVESYGLIAVTKAGQVSIPAQAQRSLGMPPDSQVAAFGELDTGRLILVPPGDAASLLEFLTEQARTGRTPSE